MFKKKFSTNEKILVAKKLGYFLKGGASLIESLGLIRLEFKSWKAAYFDSLIHSLIQGKSLHNALKEKECLFDSVHVHFIKLGEMTGTLAQSFEVISTELRKKLALKRKIQGVLLYPMIVLFASFVLVMVLLVFVFPKITSIFQSVHMKLPFMTLFLMKLSSFLQKNWYVIAGGIILFVTANIFIFRRSKHLVYLVQKIFLKIKIAKHVIQPLYLKNFCQLFGSLLKSGMSLLEVILILNQSAIAEIYKRSTVKLEAAVLKGKKISWYLKNEPHLFPPLVTSFISAGENSGNLSESFLYLAEIYEESAEAILTKLSSLMEPLIMIVIGCIVGVIALSIISPIYQLTSNLNVK